MANEKKINEITRSLVNLVRTSTIVEPISNVRNRIELYELNTEGKYEKVKDFKENNYKL